MTATRSLQDVLSLFCGALLLAAASPSRADAPVEISEVVLFRDAAIGFDPEGELPPPAGGVSVEENGRVVSASVSLPDPDHPVRITVRLVVRPVPKDERSMHDRYDRAGSLRLRTSGAPDLEVVRFITAYGGKTEHTVDVSHFAPLLRGERTFLFFIDTWTAPAWQVDASLCYEGAPGYDAPSWASAVYLSDSFNHKEMPGGAEAAVEVPEGIERVVMKYTATGHCTDGIDADEFVSKANVVAVDGVVVSRFHPWRDDCRRFRDRNPYAARWSDGTWSSDYSRSGWCPGVEVLPVEIDLTDRLAPGRHVIRFSIDKMRPADENGHFGYWRVSSALVGWDHEPELWKN
ncbi:MAG: peptide-N-glycosidase F-related protein [Candidatus Eisenbacteria bacterium]